MKVLVIVPFVDFPPTAGETSLALNWARAANLARVHVKFLSLSSKNHNYKRLYGIDSECLLTKRPSFQYTLIDLFGLQTAILRNAQEFDIIHFANNVDGLSFTPILSLLKLIEKKTINTYIERHLDKRTFLNRNFLFDMLTVTSNRLFRFYVERGGISSKKIKILPPCVDTDIFKPRDKISVREELNLPKEHFLIFTAGHFRKGRRILQLIKNVKDLKSKYQNVSLVVGWTGLGDSGLVREIFSIARKLKYVKVIQPTRNIHLYYNAADIYVFTARPENVIETPVSIVEALSSGTPVVTFNVNAVPEIVKDNFNGYVIKDGNFFEMKQKLALLIENSSYLKRFSKNARCTALNKFSHKTVGNILYNIYEELTVE